MASLQVFPEKIVYPPDLPICAEKEAIIEAIRNHQVVIISGDTGSGKTTQLPKMCIEAGYGRNGLIGCTQPRRLAAMTVADRVAEELQPFGHLVGSKIRFSDTTSRKTRIKFMTDGILLAEMQHDRQFQNYEVLIIDEAHERSLNIDFLLGILKPLLKKRADFRLIVSSATLDTEKFSEHFFNAPVLEVSGRTYPVDVVYFEADKEDLDDETTYVEKAVEAALQVVKKQPPGDILVFMPTERDILETADLLRGASQALTKGTSDQQKLGNVTVLPLFGRLQTKDQRAVFAPSKKRKIVLATNVAETSLTVPGIRYVIDTGLARITNYSSRSRSTKMPVTRIARASADQRKGRCGRVGPGVCIRLYSEDDYLSRADYVTPELLRSNLAEVLLQMMHMKLGNPLKFPFVDKPNPRLLKDGLKQLEELGAIEGRHRSKFGGFLTRAGKKMAQFPLDPALSRMIIEARRLGCLHEVLIVAAALSIQDPRIRPIDREAVADKAHETFVAEGSDFITYVNIWQNYHEVARKVHSRNRLKKYCQQYFLSYQRMREWSDIYEQLCRIISNFKGYVINGLPAEEDLIHRAILSGILTNIALKKEGGTYSGTHGKELAIFPGSVLYKKNKSWIMAAELVETSRLYARCVAGINPAWIEPLAKPLCRYSYSSPHWEKKKGQVIATEKVTFLGLVLENGRRVNYARIDPEESRQIFIQRALVEADINRNYAFLVKNQALIASLSDVEHKTRSRGVLVDEYTLFRFYDQRLPEGVCDQAGLNRVLKKIDRLLTMCEEDILASRPDEEHASLFPDSFSEKGFTLQLRYRFEPGADDDGVNVLIPQDTLSQVDPSRFEWLVPGLLLEKITALLKSLPKSLRRQLVPVNETAQAIKDQLTMYEGPFLEAICRVVRNRFMLAINPADFNAESLAAHLQARYCLVDERGKIIQASRIFSELSEQKPTEQFLSLAKDLSRQWAQKKCAPEMFKTIPERLAVQNRQGKILGFLFPALGIETQKSTPYIQLCYDPQHQARCNKEGLLYFFEQGLAGRLPAFRKMVSYSARDWFLFEGVMPIDKLNDQLVRYVLAAVAQIRSDRLPTQEEFRIQLDMLKENLHLKGQEIYHTVKELLGQRRLCLQEIARYEKLAAGNQPILERLKSCRNHLEQTLSADFLHVYGVDELCDAQRYLKALERRIERAYASPWKDREKSEKITHYEQKLAKCQDILDNNRAQLAVADITGAVHRYRTLFEELKVSIFAPEIKTAQPVSAKRLDSAWEAIENAIRITKI